ncbi:MAG: hypothetical protein M0C28_08010 [Candidatus Moduliflexus flocculans]|nr:hypothetical protein [Candidatus Moduliflexus flocculans]
MAPSADHDFFRPPEDPAAALSELFIVLFENFDHPIGWIHGYFLTGRTLYQSPEFPSTRGSIPETFLKIYKKKTKIFIFAARISPKSLFTY